MTELPKTENSNNKNLIGAVLFATVAIIFTGLYVGTSIRQANVLADFQVDPAINLNADQQYENYVRYAQRMEQTVLDLAEGEYESVQKDDIIRGSKRADITIIEYSDFECPYCKMFHETANQVVANDKDLNWVYRHFPLSFHEPEASNAAVATECVKNITDSETAFAYTDLIFENGPGLDSDDLMNLAETLAVDTTQLQNCYDKRETEQTVREDLDRGVKSFIRGTPGLIIVNNDTKQAIRIAAALSEEQLTDIIEQMRNSEAVAPTSQ